MYAHQGLLAENPSAIGPGADRALQVVQPDFVAHVYDHRMSPTAGRRVNRQAIRRKIANRDQPTPEYPLFASIFKHRRVGRFEGGG